MKPYFETVHSIDMVFLLFHKKGYPTIYIYDRRRKIEVKKSVHEGVSSHTKHSPGFNFFFSRERERAALKSRTLMIRGRGGEKNRAEKSVSSSRVSHTQNTSRQFLIF